MIAFPSDRIVPRHSCEAIDVGVYFFTCRDANAVKIGFSGDPSIRLKEVQAGCPLPLELEAVIMGSLRERESELHRQFADERIRGEWFTITPLIESMIHAHRVR
jgi:hypothetical protein